MNFNIISVALLCIVAFAIMLEIIRAINRGFRKNILTIATIFSALFISIVVTNFVSKFVTPSLFYRVDNSHGITQSFDEIASINDILFAYIDAVISPFVFVVLFVVFRILISIVVSIVYKKQKEKTAARVYEDEDAPAHKKNPKIFNALLGALCGLLLSVIFISPIMGSLKVCTGAIKALNANESSSKVTVKSDFTKLIDVCSKDAVGNVVYYCGGNLIYKSVATSKLNDNHFALEKEAKATIRSINNVFGSSNMFSNIDSTDQSSRDSLRNIDKEINSAETLKTVYADIVPELSKKWLNGEDYNGMKKPRINSVSETFFNKMLFVCKSSTPDTVGEDFSTLINVYIIAYENGILSTGNYKEMIEKAKATGAFEQIKRELSENPRMAGISLEVDEIAIKSVAKALKNFNFENYDYLMNNIANTLSIAMNYEGEAREQYISNMTKNYINNYGIDIGEDIVDEITQRFMDEVMDGKTYVTVDDVKAFWDKYSEGSSSASNVSGSQIADAVQNIIS